MTKTVKKAVSLIFKHKDLIFFINRQNYLKHFPGYTAFPGGKVSHEDLEEAEPLLNTVYREAQEELGIDVKDLIKKKTLTPPKKIAIATTPEFNPYRFETHFYLLESKTKLRFMPDLSEFSDCGWVSPFDILRSYYAGELLLVEPVKDLFEKISEKFSFDNLIDYDSFETPKIPQIENIKNLVQMMPLSRTLPPAERTNCFLIGETDKIMVDPSPKDMEEYRLILKAIEIHKIQKIVITHHHGDHHQHAPDLAKHLSLPLCLSSDTKERLDKVFGINYLEGCELQILKEGDIVGRWLGQDILVYEIPGHDNGHIGLAPEKLNWFIVGDLFQGIGSVVVGGEEGNMKKYFESLKKVIKLSPRCVIPSHGIPLGGTHILEKTLEHRIFREKQILELFQKNPDNNYILKTVYFDIPRYLHPYALANIKAHLEKLASEGKIQLKV